MEVWPTEPRDRGDLTIMASNSTAASVVSEVRSLLTARDKPVLMPAVDSDFDDRPARRHRYEEPVASRLRREIVLIAEAVSAAVPNSAAADLSARQQSGTRGREFRKAHCGELRG
jgi:hypothetical protein